MKNNIIDRNSNTPLYMQFKTSILARIQSGEWKAENAIPTELELCEEYGISRFPARQALTELVEEGLLVRTKRKGTFVSTKGIEAVKPANSKILALIMGSLTDGFNADILNGFEKLARKKGYGVMVFSTDLSVNEEINCIDRAIELGCAGICIFPSGNHSLKSKITELSSKGIYVCLLDQNMGLEDFDYIGSDNLGGSYSAVRYLYESGFTNLVFLSLPLDISSINERFSGYMKAIEDFNLNHILRIDIGNEKNMYLDKHIIPIESLVEELDNLKPRLPVGIFALNDFIALQCINAMHSEGYEIGKDFGIVGFDNIPQGAWAVKPLTTIAQNGMLLGHNAAEIAINKIEGKTRHIYKSIVPTQLVVRESCGEKLK